MKLKSQKTIPTATAMLMVLLTCSLLATSVLASSTDQERATQAVQAGDILSLRVILERLEQTQPGQVLDVEFEQKQGVWIYELKILKAGGRLQKLKVDAKTGEIISNKER
ncbi:MAG: PepSY domain-containing protein [Candidatus Methylopumilus sp.]|nr:PepSY domain-containing protein [Candidatus Methylopumilus sp.]